MTELKRLFLDNFGIWYRL